MCARRLTKITSNEIISLNTYICSTDIKTGFGPHLPSHLMYSWGEVARLWSWPLISLAPRLKLHDAFMARTGTATSFLTLLLCHKVVNTNTIYKHLSPKNFCNSVLTRGPDSVVSIATRQWAGPSGVRTSSAARDISRLQNVQTSSGANSVSYSQGTRVISEGENWSGGIPLKWHRQGQISIRCLIDNCVRCLIPKDSGMLLKFLWICPPLL